MTLIEGTLSAFERYNQMLIERNIQPKDLSNEKITYRELPKMLPHARWMCETAIKRMKDGSFSFDKVSRWLGFVQAIMIFNGLTTIEEERNITRPWFNKEDK